MRSERYSSEFVKLGLQIKKIREDKNLTQQKLADKVGLHLSYIGNIEIGAKRPSSPFRKYVISSGRLLGQCLLG